MAHGTLEAVRHQIHTDPQAALRQSEHALQAAQASGDAAALAEAKIARALAERNVGRFSDALAALDAAKALYEGLADPVPGARVDVERLRTLIHLGRYAEAQEADRLARSVLTSQSDRAHLDTNLGILHAKSGRFTAAKETLGAACRALHEAGDPQAWSLCLANLATVHLSLDEVQAAQELFETCTGAFREQGMSVALAKLDLERAFLARRTGHFDQALEFLIEGQEVFERLGMRVETLIAKLHAAEIYLHLNLISEALESAQEAGRGFETLGMAFNAALAEAVAGKAYDRLGEAKRALALLRSARRAFEEMGHRVQVAEVDWDLSEHFLKAGEHQAALGAATSAGQAFAQEHLPSSRLLADLNVAEAHRREGRDKEALAILKTTLEEARARRLDEVADQAAYGIGKIQEASGALKDALDSYVHVISGLERMRSLLGVEDYRISFVEGRMAVFEDAVALALQLGERELALNLVERAKSRTLIEAMAARAEGRYREQDARLARKMHGLREELNWLYNRIKQQDDQSEHPSGTRGTGPKATRSRLIKRMDRVEQKLVELMRRQAVRFPPTDETSPVSVSQVQALLDPGTVLIEYYQARDALWVFVIEHDSWDVVELDVPAETVRTLVAVWELSIEQFSFGPSFVERHQRRLLHQATRHLTSLYHQLVRPVESHLAGKKRLFVVPHGAIHKVPFHALWSGQAHLDDVLEVGYAPSLTALARSLGRQETPAKRALVVGASDEATPRLAQEVRQVGHAFDDARVVLDDAAVEEKLYAYAPQCDVLHLACHGVFREDNPAFSWLQLNGTRLIVADVARLKLRASLVTLSACRSGVSKITAGDELLGLVRAFLTAGAKSLLVSMWWADDQATSELMEAFYGRLKAGSSRSSALREAQVSLRARHPHPYYWAPFVLIGGG